MVTYAHGKTLQIMNKVKEGKSMSTGTLAAEICPVFLSSFIYSLSSLTQQVLC